MNIPLRGFDLRKLRANFGAYLFFSVFYLRTERSRNRPRHGTWNWDPTDFFFKAMEFSETLLSIFDCVFDTLFIGPVKKERRFVSLPIGWERIGSTF